MRRQLIVLWFRYAVNAGFLYKLFGKVYILPLFLAALMFGVHFALFFRTFVEIAKICAPTSELNKQSPDQPLPYLLTNASELQAELRPLASRFSIVCRSAGL